jgi:hypothetical protein
VESLKNIGFGFVLFEIHSDVILMYNTDHISYWEPLASHSKMAKIQKIEKKIVCKWRRKDKFERSAFIIEEFFFKSAKSRVKTKFQRSF